MIEVLYFARWWIVLTVTGLLTLPLSFRLFRWLPDRGYGLSRPLGLLLGGYIFWLLTSLGYLRNTAGGVLMAFAGLAAIAAWVYFSRRRSVADRSTPMAGAIVAESTPEAVLQAEGQSVASRTPARYGSRGAGPSSEGGMARPQGVVAEDASSSSLDSSSLSLSAWLRLNWRLVLVTELLFFLTFAGWTLVRAHNPEITAAGGEKWMELTFLNGIYRSPNFPPLDPWLSGYAISYYYFGYVLMNILVRLTNVPMPIAFNLGIAALFSLTTVAAYSVTLNLIHGAWHRPQVAARLSAGGHRRTVEREIGRDPAEEEVIISWPSLLPALLGPLFVLVLSNLEGLLEILYAYGIGSSGFWKWLDIKDLDSTPGNIANVQRYFMWWRASRVIQDYTLQGQPLEVIQEFPFFSFLLGDMHPHVLALPFVTTAIGLAYNLMRKVRAAAVVSVSEDHPAGPDRDGQAPPEEASWWSARVQDIREVAFEHIGWQTLAILAVFLGGLAFLNTWDFPSYLLLTVGAYGLARYLWAGRRGYGLVGEVVALAVLLGIGGLVLYLPFYIGFQSQAGGFAPNIVNPTRFSQWFVMFGPFAVLILCYLARLVYRRRHQELGWRFGLSLVAGTIVAILAGLVLFSLLAGLTSAGRSILDEIQQQSGGLGALLQVGLQRRLSSPWVTVFLVAVVVVVIALLYRASSAVEERRERTVGAPVVFSLLLIGLGALLVIGPDYIFLIDVFRYRINTVFKFYYQGWLLFSIACAFGAVYLMRSLRGASRVAFTVILTLVIAGGLAYPAIALPEKLREYGGPVTLDGKAAYARANPDDYAAQVWLRDHVAGAPVIVEAVTDSYQDGARVSSFTGLPTVLGWPGHEDQWRGSYDPQGTRHQDVESIYTSRNWATILPLLNRYNVQYVYIGPLERQVYPGLQEGKFKQNMEKVFEQGGVVIYKR